VSLRPGTFVSFVAHDLRLGARGFAAMFGALPARRVAAILVAALVGLHLVAWPAALWFGGHESGADGDKFLTAAMRSGVFFALLITRTTFNISSFMGLIMVVGIVAKNGILLLDADQKFRALGFAPEEAMLQAGRRRLRPIVMTALAAIAGMSPLALALGAGSQMLQPLAIAVIGGILISMVLSLIITPAVHFYLTPIRLQAGAPAPPQ